MFLLAVAGALLSGCSATSRVSSGTDFDTQSETAIVILATRIAGYEDTTNHRKLLEPLFLQTHWQSYDPKTLQLVRGDSLVFSERNDDVFYEDDEFKHWEISTTEIPPGAYALTATFVHHTITTFFPLSGKNRNIDRDLSGLSIDLEGKIDPAKNFYFEVKPGQVVYLGHFEFVSAPHNSDFIAGVNYQQDEAAARAALKDYPGVTAEMTSLNLALRTLEAALQ
jgi:hypothetical protein